MGITTICCRLTASEDTRKHLWQLMEGGNTPLVTELFRLVAQHPDFEVWVAGGKVPLKAIKDICEPLKQDSHFAGQPGRFYTSAQHEVMYIYKAWIAAQRKKRQRLDGLKRWASMRKSDPDLLAATGIALDVLKDRARQILEEITSASSEKPSAKKSQTRKGEQPEANEKSGSASVRDRLFKLYDEAGDVLTQCAIVHLLKNGCAVRNKEEDPQKYREETVSKQRAIDRLERELASRLPKGRIMGDQLFLETLETAIQELPQSDAQIHEWGTQLAREANPLPYAIRFVSNLDLRWSCEQKAVGKAKKPKKQICVDFNGLKGHNFRVMCDMRHLGYFHRFVQDWETYKAPGSQYSASLFLLRSACLKWAPTQNSHRQKTGQPWNDNDLYLHCQIDLHALTQQGTEEIRQGKLKKIKVTDASSTQTGKAVPDVVSKKAQTNLNRLNGSASSAIPLANKPAYQGNPNLVMGVSFDIKERVAVAIVEAATGKVVRYLGVRELLAGLEGPNNAKSIRRMKERTNQFRLLARQRTLLARNARLRHEAQKHNTHVSLPVSELGKYNDRLLAKRIVDLAQKYRVSSIVLPNTKNLRDKLENALRVRAEEKIPGSRSAQKKYGRSASQRIHHWSYGRLVDAINTRSTKVGVLVEQVSQLSQGTPMENAKDLAIAGYHYRLQEAGSKI